MRFIRSTFQAGVPRSRGGMAAARLACLALCLCWLGLSLPPVRAAASGAQSPPSSPAAVPAYRQANTIAILTVDGEIDKITLKSLERRMKQAVTDGADAVVLDINTPGGDLLVTLDICNLLKSRGETPANVVAWIHPTAYSAGTIISLACREIAVAPGSTMGDAAPIQYSPLLGLQAMPATEREKALRPLLTEIIDSARRNHYDERLVQTFVMLGQELWMVEHVGTGRRIFVDRDEYQTVFGEDPPPMAALPIPVGASAVPSALFPFVNQSVPRVSDRARLDPQALRREAEAELRLPPVRGPLTTADRGQWRLLMQVSNGAALLTVKPDEAIYYGLATAVLAIDADVKAFFGAQTFNRYDENWSEGMVRYLCGFWVRAVLIAVFLVSLLIELAAPGFGVFGTAALVALLILIGAPFLAGMAQWWEILLIVVGLVLVAAELFIIPGTGLAGVAGALCLLIGLVFTFVSRDIRTAQGQNELWSGLIATLAATFVAGIAFWFISRQLHSFPFINRLILHTELSDHEGPMSAAGGGLLESMGAGQRALQTGDIGLAHTDLRPSGRADINGRLVDVKSVSTYIDKGTRIRVVSVGRFVIEVEEDV